MDKLRFEIGLIVVGVMLLSGALYFVCQWWLLLLTSLSSADASALFIAFVCMPVFFTVATALRTRLPNYGGSPPLADLLKLLVPMVLLAIVAAVSTFATWRMLSFHEVVTSSARWCLWASFLLGAGLALRQFLLVVRNIHDYYLTCAWEQHVHPKRY